MNLVTHKTLVQGAGALAIVVLILALLFVARHRAAEERSPKFPVGVEVSRVQGVSIKRRSVGHAVGSGIGFSSSSDSFEGQGMEVSYLVKHVYEVPKGGVAIEARLPKGQYDVHAASASGQDPDLKKVVRRAVEETFGIVGTRERRKEDVYALTLSGGPLEIAKAPADPKKRTSHSFSSRNGITSLEYRGEFGEFCEQLEQWLDGPVIDETKLAGAYDIQLEWSRSAGKTLADALRKKGLALDLVVREMDVLVIRNR